MVPVPELDDRYVALIGDIRGSRQHQDRAGLQQRFAEAIEAAGEQPGEAPASGPTITTGDEFQALFEAPEGVAALLVEVTDAMHPVELRFGVGLGELDTPVREQAVGMDGPCFHRAREALEEAEDEESWVRVRGFGDRFDPALAALFDLIASVRSDWTDRQREFAKAYRELGVQQAVADRFEVSKSTVSESLASAHAREVRNAEQAAASLLLEAAAREGGQP